MRHALRHADLSLEELAMHNCLQLRSLDLEAPRLSTLAITGCKMVQRLRVQGRCLTSLSLHGCRLLDSLQTTSPALTHVNLYGCLAMGDVLVQSLLSQADANLEDVVLDGLVRLLSRARMHAPHPPPCAQTQSDRN